MNIKLLADSHIPKSKPHQINRPIYMTAKARERVKTKNKTFRTWHRTRDGTTTECTPMLETRPDGNAGKQRGGLRKNLPRNVRYLPICKIQDEDKVKDKAEELNKFFSSVFTREDTANMLNTPNTKTDVILEDTALTIDEVAKNLCRLNSNKSAGPDGSSPRILKELHPVQYIQKINRPRETT